MAFSSTGNDVAKAGWLYRRSAVLHRWKRNWFVLDRNGDFRYFENPDKPVAEERIVVRVHVLSIKAGFDVKPVDPPEGVNRALCGFLELHLMNKDKMVLCAESQDDMKAWQIALEEARTMMPLNQPRTVYAPSGVVQYVNPPPCFPGYITSYGGYPGQVISAPATQHVIQTPTGTTTIVSGCPAVQNLVVVDDDPYRYRRGRVHFGLGPGYWW